MRPSQRIVDFIRSFEGFRSKPYLCDGKVWTIGYGHTRGVTEHDPPITREQAEAWLAEDVALFGDEVLRMLRGAPVSQSQFDALVSLAFNIGGPAFNGSTLLRKLRAGDYEGAARQFPAWRMADGKVSPGLVRRRAAERAMFEEG